LDTIVVGVSASDDDVDMIHASLSRELRDAGFETRPVASTESPAGAKSGGLQMAQLAISLVSGTAPALASVLIAWRNRRRSACQLHVELPDGKRLEMPLGEAEARELLSKHTSAS
jgi:hypothetical protein